VTTNDRIYMLSHKEVFIDHQHVFGDTVAGDNDQRHVLKPTDYGLANNARISDEIGQGAFEDYLGNVWWWLRTNTGDGGTGAFVSFRGHENGQRADNINNALRPALEIELHDLMRNVPTVSTVTASCIGNGEADTGGLSLFVNGSNVRIYFTADDGWHVSSITINGIALTGTAFTTAVENGYHIIVNIEENTEFVIVFSDEIPLPEGDEKVSNIPIIFAAVIVFVILGAALIAPVRPE